MPLLAETLVDEWLNRQGFFTVRGIKDGVEEIDLLGVRPARTGLEGWHVEVQASFRPVNYITPLTKEMARSLNKARSVKVARTEAMVKECVNDWVDHKFIRKDKAAARERAWPGIQWQHYFVHGVARHEEELAVIQQCGITIVPLYQVLAELCANVGTGARGAAGTDFADMMDYYEKYKAGNAAH
ncbi:MAG TPA: hypothetical protein VNV43_02675 [Candidatus Acidoferrales bacterium]|jgi:hypothetical protein|nr:hypothetical protein [Candidatus Acidoferrales bacterium]